MSSDSAPIALFDSGSGGLAVLKNLEERLPKESILYLGDLAHFPYGEKPAESIVSYCLNNGKFLQGLGAKLLIVACNTASAIGVEALQQSLSIPVIGLIDPCAKKVAKRSKGRVGILATQAAIRSRGYEKAILHYNKEAFVLPKACPTLAYIIENGLSNHPATPFVVKAAIEKFKQEGIDTLVLGCSHYPLIRHHIENALGPGITIVDSTEACVDDVVDLLVEKGSLSKQKRFERFFTSAQAQTLSSLAPLFLGRSIPDVEHYDENSCK